jgi:hypothetical protein
MTASCLHPVPWEDLVAYWADDLAPDGLERVEAHLMGCAGCSAISADVAAVAGAIRAMIPPLISAARLAELRARGLRVVENPMAPGDRKPVVFGPEIDLLIHRLGGLDLARAESVRVTVSIEETGVVVRDDPHAPFDRASGEVLVACRPPHLLVSSAGREERLEGERRRRGTVLLEVNEAFFGLLHRRSLPSSNPPERQDRAGHFSEPFVPAPHDLGVGAPVDVRAQILDGPPDR